MMQVRFTHPTRHWRDGSREDADWEDPLEGRVRRQVFLPGVLPSKNKEWSHQPLSSSRKDGDGKPTFHWWVREILIIVFFNILAFFCSLIRHFKSTGVGRFQGFLLIWNWFFLQDFSFILSQNSLSFRAPEHSLESERNLNYSFQHFCIFLVTFPPSQV